MAEARQDGAPKGTPYECYVCGFSTRIQAKNPEAERNGFGVYQEGIGVRHQTTEECMKIVNHFLDDRYYLSVRARHPEGAEVD